MRQRRFVSIRSALYRRLPAVAAAALALAVAPTPARAQPSVEQRAGNLAINGALGGLTGAVRAAVARRPVAPAFARGAAGGTLWGVGKQLTLARIPAPGLVARQLSGVGISLIASAERDTITFVFPFSVFSVEWRPQAHARPRARANATNAIYLVSKLAAGNRLDLSSTLATGAPVLSHAGQIGSERFDGFENNGLILLSDELTEHDRTRQMLPHETIHILQEDAVAAVATIPLERALLSRIRPLRVPLRYVDAGFAAPLLWTAGNSLVSYADRPWELEAYTMTTGRSTRGSAAPLP